MIVSVCMATFNGAGYVDEQLRSILADLAPVDEVVVVDDASTDNTVSIIEGIGDDRIAVSQNPFNRGYVRSFERAITLAHGDVILLADQDDVWLRGHRKVLVDALATAGVAASNLLVLGTQAPPRSPISHRPWRLRADASGQQFRNQLRIWAGIAPYFGCAMGIRRDALDLVLPFPSFLTESHDLWLATVANAAHSLAHVETPTLLRRIHASNASAYPRRLTQVAAARIMLIRCSMSAVRRVRIKRRLSD